MPSVAEVQDARAVVNRLAAAYELFAAAAIPNMPWLVDTSPYRHIGFGICAAAEVCFGSLSEPEPWLRANLVRISPASAN